MSDLTDFRRAKNDFLARDHHSPLTDKQRQTFSGLSYFNENSDLRILTEVQVFPDQQNVEMQTSTGEVAQYRRWGKIAFHADGKPVELTVYKGVEEGDIFLPFADLTSGSETYAAGRYLEPQPQPGGKLIVDFNYAYNPYCAYNESWSCPIPPFENRLTAAIRAGEKTFK